MLWQAKNIYCDIYSFNMNMVSFVLIVINGETIDVKWRIAINFHYNPMQLSVILIKFRVKCAFNSMEKICDIAFFSFVCVKLFFILNSIESLIFPNSAKPHWYDFHLSLHSICGLIHVVLIFWRKNFIYKLVEYSAKKNIDTNKNKTSEKHFVCLSVCLTIM